MMQRYLGMIEVCIDELDESFVITFVDRQMLFDETIQSPDGFIVTVRGLNIRAAYSYTTGSGETRRVDAGDGMQWVFSTVRLRNDTQRPLVSPDPNTFSALAVGEVYPRRRLQREPNKYRSDRVPVETTVGGLVAFRTPDTFPLGAIQIRWRWDVPVGQVGAIWS